MKLETRMNLKRDQELEFLKAISDKLNLNIDCGAYAITLLSYLKSVETFKFLV